MIGSTTNRNGDLSTVTPRDGLLRLTCRLSTRAGQIPLSELVLSSPSICSAPRPRAEESSRTAGRSSAMNSTR